MIQQLTAILQERGSPGVHLCMSAVNTAAFGFYRHLGFHELLRSGPENDRVIYMGKKLST
jgi:ribosomal protein S18 acetylase RimI-like enzyme